LGDLCQYQRLSPTFGILHQNITLDFQRYSIKIPCKSIKIVYIEAKEF